MQRLYKELAKTTPDLLEEKESEEWQVILDEEAREKRAAEEADMLAQKKDSSDEEEEDGSITGDGGLNQSEKDILNTFNSSKSHTNNTVLKKKPPKDYSFPYRVRKKHFKHRLKVLDQKLIDFRQEQSRIDYDRINNTHLMKGIQKRLIELQLEKDRALGYNEETITSAVLTGAMMTYTITHYKHDLNALWEKCLADIANFKMQIIAGEKRKIEIAESVKQFEDERKDRIAQFSAFTTNYEKKIAIVNKIAKGLSREMLLKKYFDMFDSFRHERKDLKLRVSRALTMLAHRFLASAFEKWRTGNFALFGNDTRSFEGGVGSLMLQKARAMRQNVQSSLREAIAQTAELRTKLAISALPHIQKKTLKDSEHMKIMEEGISQTYLYSHGLTFLYEGDGYTLHNMFPQALNCYEAQTISIRAVKPVNVKLLAMCHGRLGKLVLKQEKHDRAIVEYDRQN